MRSVMKRAAMLMLSLCAVAGPTAAEPAKPPVRDLGEGRFQVGLVTLDASAKSLIFPAAINMNSGLVEYAIVTRSGKVHESLLKTDAEPFHIHTAILLLGAKISTNIDSAIFFDAKREIPGPKLKIEIVIPGPNLRTEPIDIFLENAQDSTQTRHVPYWIYNGSRMSDGVFLAQREGSIVSLIADPAALINNPREDRENDELWSLNPGTVPSVGTAVQVRFTLVAEER